MTGPFDTDSSFVQSFDGTVIAVRRFGSASSTPLLVCNAVGADMVMWSKSLVDVVRERPIVTWDLRGLLESEAPRSDRIDAGAHAEDAMAALDDTDADDFVIASWSNGTRIALEIAHRYPDRVRALVLISGAQGYSVTSSIRHLEIAGFLPTVMGVAKHFAGFLEGPLRGLTSRPELAGLVRQSGLVGATADIPALVEVLQGMARCDLRSLLATYEALAGDPASDILETIEAPTLVIAGEKDHFTSVRHMGKMTQDIPGARMVVYEKASHYLPIEFPARLSEDLRKFFAEVGG